jgi:hypothetical protein
VHIYESVLPSAQIRMVSTVSAHRECTLQCNGSRLCKELRKTQDKSLLFLNISLEKLL